MESVMREDMTDMQDQFMEVMGRYSLNTQKEGFFFCISSLHDIEHRLAFSLHLSDKLDVLSGVQIKTEKMLRYLCFQYEEFECDLTRIAHWTIKDGLSMYRKCFLEKIAGKINKLTTAVADHILISKEIITDLQEYIKDHGPATASVSAAAADDICSNLNKCIRISQEICVHLQSLSRWEPDKIDKKKNLKEIIVESCNKIRRKFGYKQPA